MTRTRRAAMAVLALGLALGSTGPALAEPAGAVPVRAERVGAVPVRAEPAEAGPATIAPVALPTGWEITDDGSGPQLVWHAPDRVPMGDAAVEFYAGGTPLGRPRADRDRRTFRLPLAGLRARDLTDLQVRAAGRTLDRAGTAGRDGARRTPGTSTPPPAVTLPPAGAPLPANAVDPGKPGRYRTITGEYALPGVRLPGFPAPVEMRGVVVAPANASGRRPLVLFLHGRHETCYKGTGEGDVNADWPCGPGAKPIPSHRGYLQAQRLLASQGYVTVSIAANGVNGQDYLLEDGGAQARSSLVRLHLARWADWAGRGRTGAPAVVRTAPRADLSRVLLIGHSRGGEGVNRAAMDSLSPPPASQDGYRGAVRWRIRGTVLIGPTLFGHNPAPDVPSATILPGCDGDVSDLQGQIYLDGTRGVSRGAALHSALYMVGANHNFFNTEWTPGQAVAPAIDDFWSGDPDPVCSPGTATRLTAVRQQRAGATYFAAAARLFVAGDDRVRPLLDGSGVRAPSADPARVLSHALGAVRTPALVPDTTVRVSGDARVCPQVHADPAVACLGEDGRSPHFVPFTWMSPEPDRYAVAVRWSAPGAASRVRPARPVSVAGADALALRIIVPPNSAGTRLDVAVTDTAGRRATLGQVRLDGLPGTDRTTSHWGQEVRLPLAAAKRSGVNVRRIAALELVPRSRSGAAWLVDAWGWRPGTPAPRPVALPRIDLGELTVDEGDSGTRTVRVPVRLSGRGAGQVRFFIVGPDSGEPIDKLVTVRPGTSRISLPVRVTGNARFGHDRIHAVLAKAVRGTTIGDYSGQVVVRNDDPLPEITLSPVADRVAEGSSLVWRMTLSAVADADIWTNFAVIAPTSGVELSSTDVDPDWFREVAGQEPAPSRPLSRAEVGLWAAVPPGELTAQLSIPTITDRIAETEEHIIARQLLYPPDGGEPALGVTLTGTVTDGP